MSVFTEERSGQITVADVAALAAFPATSLEDGSIVAMTSVLDEWQLDRSSTLVPDGITIVAAIGGGNFLRRKIPNLRWQVQASWHISQATGDDENVGDTTLTALASYAEFNRRVGLAIPPGIFMLVTFDDPTHVEDIEIKQEVLQVPPFSGLCLMGTRAVVRSGTFTVPGTTPYVIGTSPGVMDDTALAPGAWTANLNQRVVLTNAPNSGAVGWVMEDLGGTTARYSPFYNRGTFTTIDPAVGNTYDVITTTVISGAFTQTVQGAFTGIVDLLFDPGGGSGSPAFAALEGVTIWTYCGLDADAMFEAFGGFGGGINHRMEGCRVSTASGQMPVEQTELFMAGCYMQCETRVLDQGRLNVTNGDSVGQRPIGAGAAPVNITVANGAVAQVTAAGSYGMFDQPGAADTVCTVQEYGNFDVAGFVWGFGNSYSFGCVLLSAGRGVFSPPAAGVFSFVSPAPVTNDFSISGNSVAIAGLPFDDAPHLAGLVDRT